MEIGGASLTFFLCLREALFFFLQRSREEEERGVKISFSQYVGESSTLSNDGGEWRFQPWEYKYDEQMVEFPGLILGEEISLLRTEEGCKVRWLNWLSLLVTSGHFYSFKVSPDIPDWVFFLGFSYLFCIALFGVLANTYILILFAYGGKTLLSKPFNLLLLNLTLAECMVAFFGTPVDALATYQRGWKMGEGMCVTTGFILTTSGKWEKGSFIRRRNLLRKECV